MRAATVLAALSAAGFVAARPGFARRQDDTPDEPVPDTPSPFEGRKLYVNPDYAEKLEETYAAFEEAGDAENAAKVRTIQDIGTFVWISSRDNLVDIDTAIERARAAQQETGEEHIVGLVSNRVPRY